MWAPLLWDCPVSYLMFSSILRRKPAARSHQLRQPKLSPDMDKCPQGDKTTFTHIDNHYLRQSWQEGKEKSNIYIYIYIYISQSLCSGWIYHPGFYQKFLLKTLISSVTGSKLTLLSPWQANGFERRGVEARNSTIFGEPADRDCRLMSPNNHLIGI